MRFGHSYPPPGVVRSAKIGRLLSSVGALKQIADYGGKSNPASPADGDRHQFFLWLDGSETLLEVNTVKGATRGIFDVYVNGALDSSGYDDYAAGDTASAREITLTIPIVAGANMIELVLNGKNALSSAYSLHTNSVICQ